MHNILPALVHLFTTATRNLLIPLLALLLAGCGGLESSSSDGAYNVQGSAVKGPLAHAGVAAYLLDPARSDLKGQLVALGLTDERAALQLSIPSQYASSGPFLLEYTGGSEINGGTPAIAVLRTILTSSQLLNETPVFATPLSTFVLAHASTIADLSGSNSSPLRSGLLGDADGTVNMAEFMQALEVASGLARDTLGLGVLSSNIDLFTTSPLLDGSAAAADILALRTANEVFAALVIALDDELAAGGPSPGGDALLAALAEDFGDGVFDQRHDGIVVGELAQLTDIAATLAQNPVQLLVPGTSTPIADLAGLLLAEANTLELPGSSQQLQAQTLAAVQTSVFETGAATGDPEPDPEPEPEPEPVNTAPSVSITSPAAGAQFAHDQIIAVQLAASDAENNLSHCDIAVDGNFVTRDQAAPYTASLGVLAAGGHTVSTTCVDASGLAASAQRQFSVDLPPIPDPGPTNVAPTAAITSPATNSVFDAGIAIAVAVDAQDSDGSIAYCDLSVDGTFASRDSAAPYLFNGGVLNSLLPGAHNIAVACSDNGGLAAAASISVAVNAPPEPVNLAPTASFAAPLAGQDFIEGAEIYVRIDTQDSDGSIAHCNLSLDGNSIRQENFAPYEWGFAGDAIDAQFADLAVGEHQLLGVCVDDDDASTSISQTFTVTAAPNAAPVASFATPSAGQVFGAGSSLSVELAATDSDGSIAGCELSLDGQSLGIDNSAPYSFSGGTLAEGAYSLQGQCTDNEGLTSAPVQITVTISAEVTTTANVALDWVVPTTREDGSALPASEIDSYEIYYYAGSNSQNGSSVNVPARNQTGNLVSDFVITALDSGNYSFTIATIDTEGNVSAFVDPVALAIP